MCLSLSLCVAALYFKSSAPIVPVLTSNVERQTQDLQGSSCRVKFCHAFVTFLFGHYNCSLQRESAAPTARHQHTALHPSLRAIEYTAGVCGHYYHIPFIPHPFIVCFCIVSRVFLVSFCLFSNHEQWHATEQCQRLHVCCSSHHAARSGLAPSCHNHHHQ